MRWTEVPAAAWRTPQELVQEGFRRSRVVMLNEAHDGLTRCVRTRRLGRQILPSAYAMGARHLAMEALQPGDAEAANTSRRPPDAAGGYLAQPDMGRLIQAALELGWTLWRYEADVDHAPAALVEQGLMSQGSPTGGRPSRPATWPRCWRVLPRATGCWSGAAMATPTRPPAPTGPDGPPLRRPGGGGGLRHRPDGDGRLCRP